MLYHSLTPALRAFRIVRRSETMLLWLLSVSLTALTASVMGGR